MWKLLIGLPRFVTVIVTVTFCRAASNVTVALPKPAIGRGGTSWLGVSTAPSVCADAEETERRRTRQSERATGRRRMLLLLFVLKGDACTKWAAGKAEGRKQRAEGQPSALRIAPSLTPH